MQLLNLWAASMCRVERTFGKIYLMGRYLVKDASTYVAPRFADRPQPLLTIAIPTYNRGNCLRESLNILLEQLVDQEGVELLISDNCSTDDTADMLERFQALGLKFRHLKNVSNIGADANFLQCFDQANGEYFWLLGDDDVLVPDAIMQITELLRRGARPDQEAYVDFDLAYLSSFSFMGKYENNTKHIHRDVLGRFAEVMTDGRYFTERVNALITMISGVIINKNKLVAGCHLPIRKLHNSSLAQLAWILPLIEEKMRVLYVWEPLIGYRTFNSGGWGPCQVFGVNLQQIASLYFSSQSLRNLLMNGVITYWFPTVILHMREERHPSLLQEDFAAILQPIFRKNWRYWVLVYPVIALPLWLARIISKPLIIMSKLSRASRMLWHHFATKPTYIKRYYPFVKSVKYPL